jgi:hypothetical protein
VLRGVPAASWRICRECPATALARLADPDPIDGLAMAPAEKFSEHYRADVAFSGIRDYSEGVSRFD